MEEKPKNNKLCAFFKDITIQKVIVFLLIATIGILIFNLYCQSAKIEGLNEKIEKLSALNNSHLKSDAQAIFQSNFKDDLVLNSFSNSITIIIAFFTTLIALAAVFSFKEIDKDIKTLKISTNDLMTLKEQIKSQLLKMNELKENLTNLEYSIVNSNLNRVTETFQLEVLEILSKKETENNMFNFRYLTQHLIKLNLSYREAYGILQEAPHLINEINRVNLEKMTSNLYESLVIIEDYAKNITDENLKKDMIAFYNIQTLNFPTDIPNKDIHVIAAKLLEFAENNLKE